VLANDEVLGENSVDEETVDKDEVGEFEVVSAVVEDVDDWTGRVGVAAVRVLGVVDFVVAVVVCAVVVGVVAIALDCNHTHEKKTSQLDYLCFVSSTLYCV